MTNDDVFFDVTDAEQHGVSVLHVRGEIDVATSPGLRNHLNELIERGHEIIIVNLTEVSFIDSTGLGVLVGSVRRIRAIGGDLRLVVTQPHIIKLLDLTGLDDVFSVAPNLSDAARS